MTTNNAANIATGAANTVLTGQGVGSSPTFSGTPQVTSISFGGSTLSNYDEGTYSPTMVGGTVAGTTTYTTQNGFYRRIGTLVTVQQIVGGSAATGTGAATFGALPFTIKNQGNGTPLGSFAHTNSITWAWPASSTMITSVGLINTTTGTYFGNGSTNVGANLSVANAAFVMYTTMTYEI